MVKELMEEYNLEIDDIRWYMSCYLVEKIQSLLFDPKEVAKYIWSGEMETFLYDMEEKFLRDLEDQWNRNISDESQLRSIFEEVRLRKINRG